MQFKRVSNRSPALGGQPCCRTAETVEFSDVARARSLPLVITGRLNKQIAGQLELSEVTVKVHRGQIMRKMRARFLVDLVRMTDKLGIQPGKR
jgi:hypothetical protein